MILKADSKPKLLINVQYFSEFVKSDENGFIFAKIDFFD